MAAADKKTTYTAAEVAVLEDTIQNQQNQIQAQQEQIDSLKRKLDHMNEVFANAQRARFGQSSEKTSYVLSEDQICLFNEAEKEQDHKAVEPTEDTFTVKAHARKKKRTLDEMTANLPEKEILLELPESQLICDKCGGKLKAIGKKFVRREMQVIPRQVKILAYYTVTYACDHCEKDTGFAHIVSAKPPIPLMKHSLASPSSVADIMAKKYADGLPLARQEKIWAREGVELSRATMANWVIRCAQDYLFPVIAHMQMELLSRDILHCDETPIQVLKEEGKKPQTKSYMWLYRSGNDQKPPIVLYDYQPSRNGDHAATYLKDFKGYVHSDGYSGYNKLSGITRVGCWAHLRRKFVEAIPAKKSDGPPTSAELGRQYCDKLFAIEDSLKNLSDEERKIKRLELEKPVLEAFWCWLESLNTLKGSALGKAVTYALNQRPYMENYLLDGRCAISNNIAENAIRPFTVGRKNWLFADTPKGATSSAAIYSLIETAKANGLNVYAYLEHLLLYMPGSEWQRYPEELDNLMPWSPEVQENCK